MKEKGPNFVILLLQCVSMAWTLISLIQWKFKKKNLSGQKNNGILANKMEENNLKKLKYKAQTKILVHAIDTC